MAADLTGQRTLGTQFITDARNGVPIVESSGLGIAIGNASYEVKGRASAATDSYGKEDSAKAVVRTPAGKELAP